uniref:Uncharacterized protein n=1 Tax=Sphaerodactylus townsendi TaxID=933632 RepID=A0ACB8FUQ3_9SAUR
MGCKYEAKYISRNMKLQCMQASEQLFQRTCVREATILKETIILKKYLLARSPEVGIDHEKEMMDEEVDEDHVVDSGTVNSGK